MEYIAILIVVILYQWIFIPILKRKVGYIRVEGTMFYQYKTKWQLPFELAVIAAVVLGIVLLTPTLELWSVAFIPIGFIVILVTRGILEKKYDAYLCHHIISFVQALSVMVAFAGIFIYSFFIK
ncbi:hypothetical protein P9B03_18950 [Metasolibacillus meyeri]|uniref:DUF4181 domain-containing protein n=1 Tax=Metasolibacillus meyeri TaxID=1071052 RepID=A0AAW9NNX3_9BACL|nr:hypothetical protein [Metasolibacillus meyeri]MEC1180544.1 hypothetical protein [Metasolibacillus meyeri]